MSQYIKANRLIQRLKDEKGILSESWDWLAVYLSEDAYSALRFATKNPPNRIEEKLDWNRLRRHNQNITWEQYLEQKYNSLAVWTAWARVDIEMMACKSLRESASIKGRKQK